MSRELLTFDIKDVEESLYPIACEVFQEPGYVMPRLQWHDRNRMDSALNAIRNGEYDDVLHAAAALAYYVNKGHALQDGNKRMTVVILYSFLLLNGYIQRESMTYDDVVSFTEWLAASEQADQKLVIEQVRERLAETMRPMTDSEIGRIAA